MKILISSLQVTQGASKGHLHPAIEIGLELKRLGHAVAMMPLPSPFDNHDRQQVRACGFTLIEPPALPDGLPLPPHELARLAKSPKTVVKAFHSFVVAPLNDQFEGVMERIQTFKPDIVVYDLMVYAPAFAARKLGIPDIGYCAGLKLVAPAHLTATYQAVRKAIASEVDAFLARHAIQAQFHHLECLASTYQLVFAPAGILASYEMPTLPNVVLAGSLPMSEQRLSGLSPIEHDNKPLMVLCFGSVLDPADYPTVTHHCITAAEKLGCHLVIRSAYPERLPRAAHVSIADFLSLPSLLSRASIFIHHGGANTFSEAMTLGVPQLLIPLANDQPIQADILQRSGAGLSLPLEATSEENIHNACRRLLNKNDSVHAKIQEAQRLYAPAIGAKTAAQLIQQI